MSELPDRLRAASKRPLHSEAADRIEALEATLERVRKIPDQLRDDFSKGGMPAGALEAIEYIDTALKQHPEPSAQKATLILGHPDGGPRDG